MESARQALSRSASVPRKTQSFRGFRVDHALRLLAFSFENHIGDLSFCGPSSLDAVEFADENFERKRDEMKTMVYSKPENPGFSWTLVGAQLSHHVWYLNPTTIFLSTSRSNVKEHWHVLWGHEVFVLFLSRVGDYGPRFDSRIRATKHILNWLSGEKNVGQLTNV